MLFYRNFTGNLAKDFLLGMKDDMEKMAFGPRKKKFRVKKKIDAQRPSIVSNYSVVSLSDVTDESLEVWRALPAKIREDPSLASFRKRNERIRKKLKTCCVVNDKFMMLRRLRK